MKVHELLSNETRWAKNEFSVNMKGKPVAPNSPDAVRWCVVGAIVKCYREDNDINNVIDKLEANGIQSIEKWNDKSTYETVIEKLKELDI